MLILKGVRGSDRNNNNWKYTERYQLHFPCSFAYKVVFFDLVNHLVVLYRAKHAIKKFIEAILKVMNYCKNVIKNNFNKNLVMSPEDED